MSVIAKIKENRIVLLSLLGGGILFILMGVNMLNQSKDIQLLENQHAELTNELGNIERQIAVKQAELDDKKSESIIKATGLDPRLVSADTIEAKDYFSLAFNWKSYEDYEHAREHYIESLGADNSFTKTYLPPDTVIDTDDGPLSYIDFKKIKVTMDDMFIIPLANEGDRVRYVGFVRYFMHKSEKDLANTDALEASQAIIEFTASGSNETGGRMVSEVTARTGFSSSNDDDY